MQYFFEKAGPYLAGATDPYFWTHLVMQFSQSEASVRHSAVAIACLHEQIQGCGLSVPQIPDQTISLRHYNAAIQQLKDVSSVDRQPLVLLVCIMFVCIEFMQGNRKIALAHCKHGIAILEDTMGQYAWTKEHLTPIFRRLSMTMFLFGGPNDYPTLEGLTDEVPDAFYGGFCQARMTMDDLFCRTLRVVRWGDEWRIGQRRGGLIPQDMLDEQTHVLKLLEKWSQTFTAFEDLVKMPKSATQDLLKTPNGYLALVARVFLWARYEVCNIWLKMAFVEEETSYDDYMEDFKRLLHTVLSMDFQLPASYREPQQQKRPMRFIFETGFAPLLFFLVSRCRSLWIRLEGLRMMKIVCLSRESLWDLESSIQLCRRIIEVEHNVQLNWSGEVSGNVPSALPDERHRVRETWMESKATVRFVRGEEVRGRLATFYMLEDGREIKMHTEFIPESWEHQVTALRPRVQSGVEGPTLSLDADTRVLTV